MAAHGFIQKRMKRMNLAGRLFFILLLCLATVQSASAQKRSSERSLQAAREFVQVSGWTRDFDVALPPLAAGLTQSFIELAPGRADEIRELMTQAVKRFSSRKAELAEEVAGVYAANLSTEDLRDMTRFYRSPVGRRMVRAQPEILRQSMAAGETWGRRIGAEIDAEMRRELKKRGIDL
jgi:hypothetical protein